MVHTSAIRDALLTTCCVPSGEYCDYRALAVNAIDAIARADGNHSRRSHVYEFGVANGASLRKLHALIKPAPRMLWGFDSFKGLPEESSAIRKSATATWSPGMYQADPRTKLRREFAGRQRVDFVAGWYNESLTESLVETKHMKPARYIGIDCDLHVSSYAALDWAFRNRIAVVGTVIAYDDWWVLPCCDAQFADSGPLESGEGLAHEQIARRHAVSFECVAGSCLHPSLATACPPLVRAWGAVFVVAAVHQAGGGGARAYRGGGQAVRGAGFPQRSGQVEVFKRTDPQCIKCRRELGLQ